MDDSGTSTTSPVCVAPLHIVKSRSRTSSSASTSQGQPSSSRSRAGSTRSHSQITPPPTPNSSQETLLRQLEPPQPVFHRFFRAFFPFRPTNAISSSTVALCLNEGEIVMVHSIHTNGWADGTLLASGARGWLPTNYCEPYEAHQIRNLLKALLNFWDMLRGETQASIEVFYNQEFMKGMIAGVRFLLETTDCLTRESELVKGHPGLRSNRKALLADLSGLVRIAKRLQDVALGVDTEDQMDEVIEEIILKAFKIVIRGSKFLDIWERDFGDQHILDEIIGYSLEESIAPPTPPQDSSVNFAHPITDHPYQESENGSISGIQTLSGNDLNSVQRSDVLSKDDWEQTSTATRRHTATRPTSAQINRLSISHRVSYTGPSTGPRNYNLASERLRATHDIFLTYLASFIGRLHIQSRSSKELLLTTQQSVASGRDLLAVVEEVWERDSQRADSLEEAKDAMYGRITDLVLAARDVVLPMTEHDEPEDLLLPDEGKRLMGAATGCVKAAGECVAKTKFVIERIGDFEFELSPSGLGITGTTFEVPVNGTNGGFVLEPVEPQVQEKSPPEPLNRPPSPPSFLNLDDEGSLPDIPSGSSTGENMAQTVADPLETNSVPSSLAPLLPPLPPLASPLMSEEYYLSSEVATSKNNEDQTSYESSLRADSIGVSSTSTYVNGMRDSKASLISHTSSRATTPDPSLPTHGASALNMEHSMCSSETTLAEDCDENEARILEKTFAHELVFNKDGQITGGTLPALVERLTTHDSTPDSTFVSAFYLTFRLFTTPVEFATALINRFHHVDSNSPLAAPIRLRVYNGFKGWIESHWRHNTDKEALEVILPFAHGALRTSLPAAGKRLAELAEKVSSVDGPLVPRLVSSIGKTSTSIAQYISPDTPLPPPVISRSQLNSLKIWKTGGSSPSILDFDPLELARQFTLKESRIFCSILPDELLATEWMKKSGSIAINVRAMSTLSTDLANLVADTILHFDDAKRRALIIKQWVKIANKCLELNNYDSLMAIICSLNSSTILRLKRTWEVVSLKTKVTLNNLRGVVEVSRNYAVLRQRLQNHVPPCLPFVGTYLTDLTFVDVGNQATRQLPGDGVNESLSVINFDKHMKTAKIIGELQRFQIPYRLTEVPELQEWIQAQIVRVRSSDQTNVQEYYRRSLLLEPREPASQCMTPVETQHSNSSFLSWGSHSSKDKTPTPSTVS